MHDNIHFKQFITQNSKLYHHCLVFSPAILNVVVKTPNHGAGMLNDAF
jgi:hypothetical protein